MEPSLFNVVFLTWGVITAGLICLVIYRSMLANREGDQIFPDAAEAGFAREQQELILRIDKLSKPITGLMIVSGVLFIGVALLWLRDGFRNF
ncbi:MAG: hypothetical protein ACRD4K_01685 [Candidatus Acidiferrales bacterium]|jgi:hypothetical protein